MLRHSLLLFGLVAATSLPAGGCRSCSSCHDYSPPVAGCCEACGTCRAGSASGGYVEEGYIEEGQPQQYDDETEGDLPAPQSFELPSIEGPGMVQPVGVR
jgi:hypothetical protein